MPEATYYHKHLMYNVGLVLSRGKIVAIVDSDAMVRERFVERILGAFQQDQKIVLHLDQFRNHRRDLYPFNFPSFDAVVGEGCINHLNGQTIGVCDDTDPLHSRNYGACMCALRDDLVAIGGADEHIDYLGHICGPYDMTFRLVNYGRREMWLDDEFTYHTWHPGQAGEKNYIGPHDGRHISSRALEARFSGRIMPFLENPAIRDLRLRNGQVAVEQSLAHIISEERLKSWSTENVAKLKPRLWRVLLSSQHPVVALRLLKAFAKLLLKRVREKAVQLHTGTGNISGSPLTAKPAARHRIVQILLNGGRAYRFAKRVLEFCVYATERSRQCLKTLAAQGVREVSIYGTGDLAEILYAVTFEVPVKIKRIYDDLDGETFHSFKVLPIESCDPNREKLIITSLIGIDDKVRRLKTLGVFPDRIVVLQ
jgi:hypothetical protein